MKASRILAGMLTAAIGLAPLVPPEHAHEAEEPGAPHVIVHRHLNVHLAPHHFEHRSTIDHDEDPVLTLTSVYNVPSMPLIDAPAPTAGELIEPLTPRRIEGSFVDVEILIHGPPRAPTPLRAPPSLPAS